MENKKINKKKLSSTESPNIEWDVAILWLLRGLRGCYRVYVGCYGVYVLFFFSRKSPCVAVSVTE